MNEDKIPLAKVESDYQVYFNELTKLDENDIICRPNCKFCNHPARLDAEKKWEQSGIYANVERFFSDYRKANPNSPDMNFNNIKAHLLHHYGQQEKKIFLREYSERLVAFMNKKISDEHRMEMMKRQFEMKLHEICSDPVMDPLKQVDAMTKLGKSILDITITMAKLRGDIQSVHVVTEKLTNVWVQTIQKQQDPKIKQILLESLDEFNEIEGVPILESAE